jgi:hypothetical protein
MSPLAELGSKFQWFTRIRHPKARVLRSRQEYNVTDAGELAQVGTVRKRVPPARPLSRGVCSGDDGLDVFLGRE